MQVNFVGCRIEKMEQYNGKWYTVVGVPAVDSFSYPSKYRLQSQGQIGQFGQMIDVVCNIQGIVKEKKFVDRNTGQQKVYDETIVLFDVVTCQPHNQAQQVPPLHNTALPDGVKASK
ncbi:MAG TPA: hypothetical protein VLF09_11145 [Cellvibrio sp.]|nr:hypothetical protein [Cellvibrio sp.]